MLKRRTLGVALAAAATISVIGFGATALASSHTGATNNRKLAPAAQGHKVAAPRAAAHTHHLSLAASAFAPDHLANTSSDYYNFWDPANLTTSDTARCFNSGLTLPGNATLKSVTAYYTNTTGSDSLYFELNRQNLLKHTSKLLVKFSVKPVTTTTYESTTRKVPAVDGKVNYATYAYGLGVCPNDDGFSGVTVSYTTP
jgi:hypothetical protein